MKGWLVDQASPDRLPQLQYRAKFSNQLRKKRLKVKLSLKVTKEMPKIPIASA
jgi:hypothetical protein